jgi:outer membrane protein OmpA-like peptidoglycan-associated protein
VVSGGEGLVRIIDARNQGLYSWTAGISFAGDDHGADHMNDLNISTWDNAVFRVFGSWVPFEPFEVTGALGLGYSYPVQMAGVSPSVGPWDLELGAKYTWPLEFWTVGADARLFLPTRSSFLGGPRFGGSLRALASTEMNIYAFHLNLGGRMLEDPALLMGAGAEIKYEFLNPYLELSTEFLPDSFPLRLTPGLRVFTNVGISFYYAADFGLNRDGRNIDMDGDQYVNQISVGAAYSPVQHIAKRRATLLVQVRDASTDQPIAAQVIISEHYPSVFVVGPSGKRKLDVQSGRYKVTVSASGYLAQTYTVNFSPHRATVLDLKLEPDRTGARLIVKTIDRQTGVAIPGASVTAGGVTLVTSDFGEARFNLPPGSYRIDATAQGYIPQSETVVLSPTMPLAVTISMLRGDARVRISGIYFPSGSAVIPPSSYPAIDDAIRLIDAGSNVRIEVQGHTDSQGSAESNLWLSQRRAEAVRDYLIRVHGISPDRLTARGYGESEPIASNDTEAGRAQNRRVELVVLP